MSNPFRVTSESDKKKPTRYFSKMQENEVAKAVGGSRTKNSGATLFQKSDVLNDKFTLECKTKTTHAESISIKRDWFEKQQQESRFMAKPYSAIVFNFGPGEENHYIIDEYLFQALLEYIHENPDM